MIVLAFADEAAPAGRLAAALGATLGVIQLHEFPDGEVLPRVEAASPRTVIYRSLDRPNEKIIPLLLAADAARRAGAERLELVCPYLCYLRQDTVFTPGEPLSRDVVLPLLGRAFDRVLTVDAHLHRTADLSTVMGVSAESLSAAPVLAAALGGGDPPLVVAPDSEARPWADGIAKSLGGDLLVLEKRRDAARRVTFGGAELGAARGRRAVIVDDVASSGSTLVAVAGMLRAAGAASIEVAVTHALFGEDLRRRLKTVGVQRLVSTDSVVRGEDAAPLAGILAEALRRT